MSDTPSGPDLGHVGESSPAGESAQLQGRHNLTTSEGERWFAVNTLPRREISARQQLTHQGFRSFAPYMIRTVRHARKLRTVRAPVFPGYIFVILHLDRDRWRSVNGTFGVARLVMGGEKPQPIPPGVVEGLLALTDESSLLKRDRDLATGQAVRVIAGPFAGVLGQLARLDDNGRVRVLLDIMGGQVPTLLDRALLEPVA
jgi:transcription elongation factor/antiterminator RfaH